MNSNGSIFDDQMRRLYFRNRIRNEYAFFDNHYWELKNKAFINIMIMSHGHEKGYIPCIDGQLY